MGSFKAFVVRQGPWTLTLAGDVIFGEATLSGLNPASGLLLFGRAGFRMAGVASLSIESKTFF